MTSIVPPSTAPSLDAFYALPIGDSVNTLIVPQTDRDQQILEVFHTFGQGIDEVNMFRYQTTDIDILPIFPVLPPPERPYLDVSAYFDVALPVYNSTTVLGHRKFEVLLLEPNQTGLLCEFFNENYTALQRSIKFEEEFDVMGILHSSDRWKPLLDLTKPLKLLMDSDKFFKCFDASPKDVPWGSPYDRSQLEERVWGMKRMQDISPLEEDSLSSVENLLLTYLEKRSDLSGIVKNYLFFDMEELFQNSRGISELYDHVQIIREQFRHISSFLKADPLNRMGFKVECHHKDAFIQVPLALGGMLQSMQQVGDKPSMFQKADLMGMHAKRNIFQNILQFIGMVEEAERTLPAEEIERLNVYLIHLISSFEALGSQLNDIQGLDHFSTLLDPMIKLAPSESDIPADPITILDKVFVYLKSYHFTKETFQNAKNCCRYFSENPLRAAYLGALEMQISSEENDKRKVSTPEQVLRLALLSQRVYGNAKSYLDKNDKGEYIEKLPFGFGLAPYVTTKGQEYRCFFDEAGDWVATSSLVHTRSRAASKVLPKTHFFPDLIRNEINNIFNKKIGDASDPLLPGYQETLADHVNPGRWVTRYLFTVIQDRAGVVKEYLRLNPIVDVIIQVDVFTRQCLFSGIGEINPGYRIEDREYQISDSNCIDFSEISKLSDRKKMDGSMYQVHMAITDYTFGQAVATSQGQFDAGVCQSLLGQSDSLLPS